MEIVSFSEQPSEQLKNEHRRFLKTKGDQQKLVMAGRFTDKSGSLMVWRLSSMEEARDLAMEDPYFKHGITTFILKEWSLTWNFFVNPPLQPKLA
ncbi:MAG: YciI family protein [Conexivisphaerales archaeon]